MNGVISSLKVKKGERVAGNSFNLGTEMMTVSDMSVLEVRVDVGENDIVKVISAIQQMWKWMLIITGNLKE